MVGPAAEELFDPVPEQDLFEALRGNLNAMEPASPDWAGDERNVAYVVLHLVQRSNRQNRAEGCRCRLGNGAPAGQHQPVIPKAGQAYLGQEEDCLASSRADQLEEFVPLRERRDHCTGK